MSRDEVFRIVYDLAGQNALGRREAAGDPDLEAECSLQWEALDLFCDFMRAYQEASEKGPRGYCKVDTSSPFAALILGRKGKHGGADTSTMALLTAGALFSAIALPLAYSALSPLAVVLDVLQGAL